MMNHTLDFLKNKLLDLGIEEEEIHWQNLCLILLRR